MRCIITRHGMFSRNGKPIVSAPHIFAAVQHLFDSYPDLVLDGEMYNHELRHKLNRIIELVRRGKPDADDLKKSAEMVEYHVYDGYGFEAGVHPIAIKREDTYSVRNSGLIVLLYGLDVRKIFTVESDRADTQEALDVYYKYYLSEEYEGQMIRLDAPYDNKRSRSLLKRKEFQDAEFKILRLVEGEGNRAGTVGAMWCELHAPVFVKGKWETEFKSNVKGDYEFIKDIWDHKDEYVGKTATVKFFDWSEFKVPLFPYIIAIDREAAEGNEQT